MAYNLKLLHAAAASDRCEHQSDLSPVITQSTQAVELELWPQTRFYNVVYTPTENRPAPERATHTTPPRRADEKLSLKPVHPKTTSSSAGIKPRLKGGDKTRPTLHTKHDGPLRFPAFELPIALRVTEDWIDQAKRKLAFLERDTKLVRSRIDCLSPTYKAIVLSGEIHIDVDHLTEQMAKLNAKVHEDPDRFEDIVVKRYDAIADRIATILRKLDELENPPPKPPTWAERIANTSDSIAKTSDRIAKGLEALKQKIKSIELP